MTECFAILTMGTFRIVPVSSFFSVGIYVMFYKSSWNITKTLNLTKPNLTWKLTKNLHRNLINPIQSQMPQNQSWQSNTGAPQREYVPGTSYRQSRQRTSQN